ncbi:MAG TPA: SDR family oxidoreductase [Nitrososphaeraceae archaeon]|nr:SDR family oxidoreductase [Nitrososphaeraceae archaeon]
MNQKVAVVTGSSSGIGLETSLTLAENNFRTYATMRNLDKASNILEPAEKKDLSIEVAKLDVTDDFSVHQAIQSIAEKERGQIDLLVNNAGYTQLGAAEDLSSEEIQAQFNTNVFGVFRTIREVVPIMRGQIAGGKIINIGSANGFFGVPCASAYVATKFALEGLTQSLRYELAPFGIKVIIIEPGAISTNVASNSMYIPKKIQRQSSSDSSSSSSSSLSPFTEITNSIMEKSKSVVVNGSPPRVVANVVLQVAKAEKPNWRYRAGADAERLFEARTKMNDTEFEKFLYDLLGS